MPQHLELSVRKKASQPLAEGHVGLNKAHGPGGMDCGERLHILVMVKGKYTSIIIQILFLHFYMVEICSILYFIYKKKVIIL